MTKTILKLAEDQMTDVNKLAKKIITVS